LAGTMNPVYATLTIGKRQRRNLGHGRDFPLRPRPPGVILSNTAGITRWPIEHVECRKRAPKPIEAEVLMLNILAHRFVIGKKWAGRERDRGENRALPHGYECSFVSSRLRSPGFSFADSLGPFQVRRAASLDVRGLAGRSVVVAGMEGFVEAQGAYRYYAAGQPGEWRIDLTMGLRPWPRLLVMLQSFTSIVNGSLQFGHVSWTKLQPSLVYYIAPRRSVQIGGFITVAGINAGRELGPIAAVWYRF
jgi:hypothetical protein